MRGLAGSLLLIFGTAFAGMPVAVQAQSETVDLGETIFLVKNLLRDAAREADLEQQYLLYLRAESTLNSIVDRLTRAESREWSQRMKTAFARLQPPAQFETENGLVLKLSSLKGEALYWSEPVTGAVFAKFLNESKIAADDLPRHLNVRRNNIIWSQDKGFQAVRSSDVIEAVSYPAAAAFMRWLSAATGSKYVLPSPELAAAAGPAMSCWTSSPAVEKDLLRKEELRRFGVEFRNMLYHGEQVNELAEACYPELRLYAMTSVNTGRRLYLKQLRRAAQ